MNNESKYHCWLESKPNSRETVEGHNAEEAAYAYAYDYIEKEGHYLICVRRHRTKRIETYEAHAHMELDIDISPGRYTNAATRTYLRPTD